MRPWRPRQGRHGSDLDIDGSKTGSGRADATVPMAFFADESLDLGRDTPTPVCGDYGIKDSHFTGCVHRVQIDVGDDAHDADHFISIEERMRMATARQ